MTSCNSLFSWEEQNQSAETNCSLRGQSRSRNKKNNVLGIYSLMLLFNINLKQISNPSSKWVWNMYTRKISSSSGTSLNLRFTDQLEMISTWMQSVCADNFQLHAASVSLGLQLDISRTWKSAGFMFCTPVRFKQVDPKCLVFILNLDGAC